MSRLWLRDGSIVVPRVHSEDRPFHKLVLSNIGLRTACRKNHGEAPGTGNGGSALVTKLSCLEDSVNESTWLGITPQEWLNAGERMKELPRKSDEDSLKGSLITADPDISRVVSPFDVEEVRRMPIVWISSIPNPASRLDEISLKDLKKRIKVAFGEFTSPNAHSNYAEEMFKAYEPLFKSAEQDASKFRFTEIHNRMINDLRSVCGISFYLERLQKSDLAPNAPIYRILTTVPTPISDLGGASDVPAFLAGEVVSPTDYPVGFLRKCFTDFLKTGTISGVKELRYPRRSNDPAFETTMNILGRQSLVTAGKWEVAHFAACRSWRTENGDAEFAQMYGTLN